ncbi:MAG: OmpH family outer membrane protein [Granulosicoccaceae bacterium]
MLVSRFKANAVTTAVKRCSLMGILVLCMGASLALADASQIGFVDIPYLIDKAPQALEAEQRLEAEFAPRQSELERQRAELNLLSNQLLDVSADLSESERSQLDIQARSLERRIKRSEQDFREELNIQKNNEFKQVRVLVLEAIARFGKQNDYDLIVSDGVLFAAERIDVTERILEGLVKDFSRLQSSN